MDATAVTKELLGGLSDEKKQLRLIGHMVFLSHLLKKNTFSRRAANFIVGLYKQYVELHFTYLEINPLVITNQNVYILDLAAKASVSADFQVPNQYWLGCSKVFFSLL